MKTKTSILCLLFVSVTVISSAAFTPGDPAPAISAKRPAQKVENVFRSFILHRQHDGITLNWAVSSSSITSFVIEKSYDGEYFESVDLPITTVGRWNRAMDTEVFPGYIHYRVTAILGDGTECTSTVQVVRIVKRG
jgi:hypothetical protein